MQKKVVPMFHVPDVRRTVDWYRDIGFEVTVTYGDNSGGLSFAMVSFGAGEVMFSSGGRLSSNHRREVDLYAYTEDVDNLYDQIKDRVEIVEGPHNMFYGMREIIVRDLNGFWITFGQEIPAGGANALAGCRRRTPSTLYRPVRERQWIRRADQHS